MIVKIENVVGEIFDRIGLVKIFFVWMKRKEVKVIDINMYKIVIFIRN